MQSNDKQSDVQARHQYHSDVDNLSLLPSKLDPEHLKCSYKTSMPKWSNKELVPLNTRNRAVHPIIQWNHINSKIVLFIQMQLCDTTLHDWLRRRDYTIAEEISDQKENRFYSLSGIGQHQCWHIFQQLLTAVQYLHSQSFVHRDIKPRNIFLAYDAKDTSSFRVKLGDFGLTTLLDSVSTSDTSERIKTDALTGVGTALYAPPEQLNSNHSIATAKSDSYSLGIVLFELFNVFPTEMQRYCCLSDLRIFMKVDEQFSKNYPFETNVIEQLVSVEIDKRPNVEEVLTMYAKETQRRVKKQSNHKKQMIIDQLEEKLRDKERRIEQLELELERKKS